MTPPISVVCQSRFMAIVFALSCNSSCGLASGFRMPNAPNEGPRPRINTFLGTEPLMMRPAIRTLSAVPTCMRVEMLPSVAGVAFGFGVGVAVGFGVGVAVGIAVGVGVGDGGGAISEVAAPSLLVNVAAPGVNE